MSAALVERSTVVVKRRKLLGGLFALGAGIFGIVAIFPLLRSLGPVPGTSLDRTDWRKGSLLVDSNGRSVRRGHPGGGRHHDRLPARLREHRPTARRRTRRCSSGSRTRTWSPPRAGRPGPRRATWPTPRCAPTSAAPSGSTRQQLELLVCPCHQSMFNVRNGAVPQFGPAPRPLPQLPLYFDSDGTLRAQTGFDQAVGPGFFERTTTEKM